MILLKHLPMRKDDKDRLVSMGLFECPLCEKQVERRLSNGKRSKSCGCGPRGPSKRDRANVQPLPSRNQCQLDLIRKQFGSGVKMLDGTPRFTVEKLAKIHGLEVDEVRRIVYD